MAYKTNLIIVAGCILVAGIILTTYTLKHNPVPVDAPDAAICPDFWTKSTRPDGTNVCINDKKLGKSTCEPTMNFNIDKFSGNAGLCAKQEWAKQCGVTWGGITTDHGLCKH